VLSGAATEIEYALARQALEEMGELEAAVELEEVLEFLRECGCVPVIHCDSVPLVIIHQARTTTNI
jgi:hypothetical protein